MGDSSVSCVLTGVTLTHEPAVLIALAPARFSQPSRKRPGFDHGARVIANEGASALFMPVLLPIFGEMDSYGHLTDIEKNEHTAYLEARLGVSIEEIADAIVDGHKLPAMAKFAKRVARAATEGFERNLTWDGRLYGCFLAREAWDAFSSDFLNEWGKPSYSVWDEGWLNPQVLAGLGFVKGAKDVARAVALLGEGGQAGNRYHTPYTHPKVPDLVLWCDENMSSRVTIGDRDLSKETSIFHPAQLQTALRKYKRALPKAAVAWAKATPELRLKVEAARRRRNAAIKTEREQHARDTARPDLTFDLFADTTPTEIREANNKISRERFQRRMQECFGKDKKEPTAQLDRPVEPEVALTVPEGAVQSFCDGRKHISLTATADNKASNPIVCDCDGGEACKQSHYSIDRLHAVTLSFNEEAVAALVASGWKLKRRRAWFSSNECTIMRCMAPEAAQLYRATMLREFSNALIALITVERTLDAANKLWQPTNTGYQYGHLYMQRKVAELASKLLTKRINNRNA